MIVLKNVTDPLVAETRLLAAAHGIEIRAINSNTSILRMLQPGKRVKQSRLPRTARAAKKNLLAAMNTQIDPVQHLDRFAPDPVAAVEVDCFNHHVVHAGYRCLSVTAPSLAVETSCAYFARTPRV